MAKNVIITNGSGSAELINDTYTVTADVVGYDNTTINPNNVTVVDGTNTYNFTISSLIFFSSGVNIPLTWLN